MNNHPPTHQTYPKYHSVTIHTLWMVHGVGGGWWWGGWRVHGWMGGGVGGWRVHGVGWCVMVWLVVGWVVVRFMGWVVVWWVVEGFMGWVGVWCCGWWWGGWLRVNGMGAYIHPPMNNYNVKRFNFMNSHPPIKHIQSVTLLLYI